MTTYFFLIDAMTFKSSDGIASVFVWFFVWFGLLDGGFDNRIHCIT